MKLRGAIIYVFRLGRKQPYAADTQETLSCHLQADCPACESAADASREVLREIENRQADIIAALNDVKTVLDAGSESVRATAEIGITALFENRRKCLEGDPQTPEEKIQVARTKRIRKLGQTPGLQG